MSEGTGLRWSQTYWTVSIKPTDNHRADQGRRKRLGYYIKQNQGFLTRSGMSRWAKENLPEALLPYIYIHEQMNLEWARPKTDRG